MDTTTLACGTNSRKVIPLSDIQNERTGISPDAKEKGPSPQPSEGVFEKISAWITKHWRALIFLAALATVIYSALDFRSDTINKLSSLEKDVNELGESVKSTEGNLSKTLENIDTRLDKMNTRLSQIEGRLSPLDPARRQIRYTSEF